MTALMGPPGRALAAVMQGDLARLAREVEAMTVDELAQFVDACHDMTKAAEHDREHRGG